MNPTEQDVLQHIREVVKKELRIGREINSSDKLLDDLEFDSLSIVTVLASLENRYKIRISESEAEGLVTIGDLQQLVVHHAQESKP